MTEVDKIGISIESTADEAARGIEKLASSLKTLNSAGSSSVLKTISADLKGFAKSVSSIDVSGINNIANAIKTISGTSELKGIENSVSRIQKQIMDLSNSKLDFSGVDAAKGSMSDIVRLARETGEITAAQARAITQQRAEEKARLTEQIQLEKLAIAQQREARAVEKAEQAKIASEKREAEKLAAQATKERIAAEKEAQAQVLAAQKEAKAQELANIKESAAALKEKTAVYKQSVQEMISETQYAHQGLSEFSGTLGSISSSLGGFLSAPIASFQRLTNEISKADKAAAIGTLTTQLREVTQQASETQKKFAEVNREIKALRDGGQTSGEGFNSLIEQARTLGSQYEELKSKQEILKQSLSAYGAQGKSAIASIGTGATNAIGGIKGLTSAFRSLNAALGPVGVAITIITASFNNLKKTISTLWSLLKTAIDLFKRLATAIGNGVKSLGRWIKSVSDSTKEIFGLNKEGNSLERTIKRLQKVWTKLWNVFQIKVIRTVLNSLFSGVSEGLQGLAAQFGEFNAVMSSGASAVLKLKNSIAAALAPALAGLIPIVVTVINAFISLVEVVGALFSIIFGTPFYKAKDVAVDYAGALGDVGSAAKKAAKDMNMLPFDELNTIAQEASSAGGGGVSIDDWFEQAEPPDWISELFEFDPYELGYKLGQYIVEGLASIKWDEIQESAQNIAINIADFLNGAIDGILESEYPGIFGYTIAQALNTALVFAENFLDTFNFQNLGKLIGINIQTGIETFDWAALGRTIGKGINSIVDTLLSIINEINFYEVAYSIFTAISTAISTIDFNKIADLIVAGIKGAVDFVNGAIDSWESSGVSFGVSLANFFNRILSNTDWGEIGATLNRVFLFAINGIADFIKTIDVELLIESIKALLQGLDWPGIKATLKELWEEVWTVLVVAFDAIGIDLVKTFNVLKTIVLAFAAVWVATLIPSILISLPIILALSAALLGIYKVLKAIKEFFGGFKLGALGPQIKESPFSQTINATEEEVTAAINNVEAALGHSLDYIHSEFNTIYDAAEALGVEITEDFDIVAGSILSAANTGQDAFGKLKSNITDVSDASVESAIIIEESQIAAYREIAAVAEKESVEIQRHYNQTSLSLEEEAKYIKSHYGESLTGIAESAEQSAALIQQSYADIPEFFDNDVIVPSEASWQKLTDFVQEATENARSGIDGTWGDQPSWIERNVTNPVSNEYEDLYRDITGYAGDAYSDMQDVYDDAHDYYKNDVTDPISEEFYDTFEGVKTDSTAAFEQITAIWGNANEWFSEEVFNPLRENSKGFFNDIISFFESAANAIIGGFQDVINSMADAINSFSIDLPSELGGGTSRFSATRTVLRRTSIPRLKTGIANVPNDWFAAYLDKGERVLTAQQNVNYNSIGGDAGIKALANGQGVNNISIEDLIYAITSAIIGNKDVFQQPIELNGRQLAMGVNEGQKNIGAQIITNFENEW